jgi:hypothetical protein
MKTTTVSTASMSVMAAALLAVMLTRIAQHWEISFGDDFTACFVGVMGPVFHIIFVKWGLEPDVNAAPAANQTAPAIKEEPHATP